MGEERRTPLHDLPDVIVGNIFGLVDDTRSRNAMALVSHRWRHLERSTRTSITLRGNVRRLFLLPTCFASVTHLDLSLLSPWGCSFLHSRQQPQQHYHNPRERDDGHRLLIPDDVVAGWLRQAFPLVTSLAVYARTPAVIQALAPQWPGLRHVKLVRWHQRPSCEHGSDFAPLLQSCSSLSSLDLSNFYCWTEDLPVALLAEPSSSTPAAKSLTRLDLLSLSSVEGFTSIQLLTVASACPNLRHFLAPCQFDPRFHECVGDEALLGIALYCNALSTLHLVDQNAVLNPRGDPGKEGGFSPEEARITHLGLEKFFTHLPMLEDLALDVCHNVRDASPALEALCLCCPRMRSLKLGQFHGLCRASALHLDGVAVCGSLTSLTIKNSADLTDPGLVAIARGCSRLTKFEVQGCRMITQAGMRKLASKLRSTLVDVSISACKNLDAPHSLDALEPIRDSIERLHIDCTWSANGGLGNRGDREENMAWNNDIEEFEGDNGGDGPVGSVDSEEDHGDNLIKKKKCRLASFANSSSNDFLTGDAGGFWCRTWKRLRYLSLWVPVGQLLSPLSDAGLESCPELVEMSIKVEGDCRTCLMPDEAFGLNSLVCHQRLSKMKLDCADAIGYALTAPHGQTDLSPWDRFYLHGIGDLNLTELDYWPPQDKDVNQRSLSLPAVGLLAECATLRKLFIHGTTHEHFMRFLLNIRNLRDVQLREDYYPAPENDTSTEMRLDSCSRFEDALNRRRIPD